MTESAMVEPSSGRRAEMIEAALHLFSYGVRGLVSLPSVGWAAAADPTEGVRIFGNEDELIKAAVARHGRQVQAIALANATTVRVLGVPPAAEVIVAVFTAPIRLIEQSAGGRGWLRMLVSLAPDERQHANDFVQGVVDALGPLAAAQYPRASSGRVADALRSSIQMVIGAVAQYSEGVPPTEWPVIESFAAGGLNALLRPYRMTRSQASG